jgi:hypothetical protein
VPTVESHSVQFFDTSGSRADAVSAFICEGLAQGDAVLVLATPPHWQDIRRRCRDLHVDVAAAFASGRLVLRDPEEILARITYRDQPSWERFDATVGDLVRQLRAEHGTVRIFGEVVDVLARRNLFDAAASLEGFWNLLATREPFFLFCGYSAEHFGNPRDGATLRRICGLHTHVETHSNDVLANFLLKAYVTS